MMIWVQNDHLKHGFTHFVIIPGSFLWFLWTSYHLSWRNASKYIHSSALLECNFEVLVLYISIFIVCSFPALHFSCKYCTFYPVLVSDSYTVEYFTDRNKKKTPKNLFLNVMSLLELIKFSTMLSLKLFDLWLVIYILTSSKLIITSTYLLKFLRKCDVKHLREYQVFFFTSQLIMRQFSFQYFYIKNTVRDVFTVHSTKNHRCDIRWQLQ